MSLIDETIKEEFSKWAQEHDDKHIFSEISKEEDSYYIVRNLEETYLTEYSFKTVAELKKGLVEYSGLQLDEQILEMLVVEICQNRYDNRIDKQKEKIIDELKKEEIKKMELPEFVYVF